MEKQERLALRSKPKCHPQALLSGIPVIDVFAGPGGLGEGFHAFEIPGKHPFTVKLSIEKDSVAHQTLELRSFFRQFPPDEMPEEYYQYLRTVDDVPEPVRRRRLFQKYPKEFRAARHHALRAELGRSNPRRISLLIEHTIGDRGDWVLIGGPPCQVHSIIGRSRNAGIPHYDPKKDRRQELYKEFLKIIAEHVPPVFIMENVKGLLSATRENQLIFEIIHQDLQNPAEALLQDGEDVYPASQRVKGLNPVYRLYSLTKPWESAMPERGDYVVEMERYGVPQARHRVIILGIREDLGDIQPAGLKLYDINHNTGLVNAGEVLAELPPLRSGLSRQEDCQDLWRDRIMEFPSEQWTFYSSENHESQLRAVREEIDNTIKYIRNNEVSRGRGGEFIEAEAGSRYRSDWFVDERMGGVCNHSTRSHMAEDLHRYLFASCYARVVGKSPVLKHFPQHLLPAHESAERALEGGNFDDRFRVQLEDRPATTVTSHIHKDGHYYIHYDPSQCRSLTVREVARLQTFPDNYFFCGSRTKQYIQVGNAVPPLLAYQIAEIVYGVLIATERNK